MAPNLRVRRNYPYAGKGDGLTSYLRQQFSPAAYVGIELEINQKIVFAAGPRWTRCVVCSWIPCVPHMRREDVLMNSGDWK